MPPLSASRGPGGHAAPSATGSGAPAGGLHHQCRNAAEVGAQHIGQQLIPQHGRVGGICPGLSHGPAEAHRLRLFGVAHIGDPQVAAELLHPAGGCGCWTGSSPGCPQTEARRSIAAPPHPAGACFGGQGKVQIAEQQANALALQQLRRDLPGSSRIPRPVPEKCAYTSSLSHRFGYSVAFFSSERKGGYPCRCILPPRRTGWLRPGP